MSQNVGDLDRSLRIILGVAILLLYSVLPGEDRFFAFIGLVPILTALYRWCPLYTLLGITTGVAKPAR